MAEITLTKAHLEKVKSDMDKKVEMLSEVVNIPILTEKQEEKLIG